MTPDDSPNMMTAMIADETEPEPVPPAPAGEEAQEGPEAPEAEAPAVDARQALRLLEAILFASADPLDEVSLAGRLPEGTDVGALVGELQAEYAERGVNLVRAAGGWTFRTAPDLATLMRIERNVVRKLSRAAVETLAICAYHQPVTRAEIEEIRGVAISKGTLDTLFEAGWIRPMGRRRTPGRPVTWGTTDSFLSHFGLQSVADLPGIDELKAAGLLDTRPAASIVGVVGPEAGEGDAQVDEDDDETGATDAAEDSYDDPEGETRE